MTGNSDVGEGLTTFEGKEYVGFVDGEGTGLVVAIGLEDVVKLEPQTELDVVLMVMDDALLVVVEVRCRK